MGNEKSVNEKEIKDSVGEKGIGTEKGIVNSVREKKTVWNSERVKNGNFAWAPGRYKPFVAIVAFVPFELLSRPKFGLCKEVVRYQFDTRQTPRTSRTLETLEVLHRPNVGLDYNSNGTNAWIATNGKNSCNGLRTT
jgi:hypothetical protein